MDINGDNSQGRVEMIRNGLTPHALEQAYRQGRITQYAEQWGVDRIQLTAAAKAWGISNPKYRRHGE